MNNLAIGENVTIHSSLNVIRVVKSWRIRWTCHVSRIRRTRNAYKMIVGKVKGRTPPGRPIRWIILKWMSNKYGISMWTMFKWFRMWFRGGFL
jgi:hypothetical protein